MSPTLKLKKINMRIETRTFSGILQRKVSANQSYSYITYLYHENPKLLHLEYKNWVTDQP